MLFKTRGIALNYIKYRDTSIIARVYTEKFGKQSYIVNGIRSNRSKKSIGNFQPLTLLDLVVYKKDNKDIQRLSEFRSSVPFTSIPYNIKKSTIAIFLTEFFVKVLEEQPEEENQLFDFLHHAIHLFDELKDGFENFHIFLLLRLSNYLGFGLSDMIHLNTSGDMEVINFLEQMANSTVYHEVQASRSIRNKALNELISYYQLHVDALGKIKSLEVMQQVFD